MELGVLDHVSYGAYRPHHVHLLYVANDGRHLDDGSEHDVSSLDELARQRLLPVLPICHHDSAVPSQATTILARWTLDGGKVSVCCLRDGFLSFSIWGPHHRSQLSEYSKPVNQRQVHRQKLISEKTAVPSTCMMPCLLIHYLVVGFAS